MRGALRRPPPAQPAAFDSARAYGAPARWSPSARAVAGTPANAEEAREYIISTLGRIGIKAIEQPFEARTPLGAVKMVNV